MRKKFLYIILSIFIFFFNVNVVFSTEITNSEEESSTKCNYQQRKIDEYKDLTDQLIGIDCTDTSNETNVIICDDSKLKKNLIVTEFMKLNEEKSICSDKQDEVDAIIEENKDKCGKIFDDSFSDFVNGFMVFFYILGPILLILFGSLDFAKATVSSDQEALKKAGKAFSKRLFATILLFLTPTIVNILISFNVSDKYLSGNAYACDYEYLVYTKQYNIRYVPKNPSNSIDGTKDGDYIVFNQSDSAWGSKKLLCSNKETIASAGCAVTSVAMQIVNSKVETTTTINPGTLNEIMKNNGACYGASIVWGETSYATKNKFIYVGEEYVNGSIEKKAENLKKLLAEGNYPVIQVKHGTSSSTHFVAVFDVDGSEIIVGDPAGGKLTSLNKTSYPIATQNLNTRILLYKIVN